ncbi:MAG: leucine-rich repeat domain-containing protein [Eubacterium sp.]
MKKVISLFLSLAMLLSIVSVVDFSAYADVQTGSCGDNVTYSLDTETGVLTISGTGDMYSYGPFYENTNIKSVIIESGVTSIGDCAFEDCYFTYENFVNNSNVELDDSSKPTIVDTDTGGFCIKDNELVNMRPTYAIGEITIPNSVTSIDSSAFYGCSSLTSVTMSNSVTSIGNPAFENCTSLTSIEVSDNNGNYSSVDGVLFNKDKSELITYPAGKTDSEYVIPNSVISIGDSAFENCTSLTSVTIPDSVTIIGRSAFENCTSLTSVTIPNSVTSIGDYAFSNCTSLKSIEVSENNKNYASIDGVLFNKDKSELVTYPAGKTDSEYVIPNSVTSIGYSAFENCTSLTSVTIPDSVTSIDYSAFENCTSLTSVTIPNSVTSICDSAFYNTAYYNDKSNWNNGVLYISDCLIDTNYNFDSTTDYIIKDGTRIIADYALSHCDNLTSVIIPNSVTSIGDSVFSDCTSLKSVTIGNSVTSIGSSAFYNTAYYNDKSNWDKGVLYLSNCLINTNDDFGSTTDYTIKDGTRFIADSAFSGCTSLTSVTIPKSITYISDDAFENCGFINVKYEGTTKEFLKIRNIENNKALIIGRHYDVFNFNSFDVPCKQSEHLDVSNYLYSFIPDLISKRSKENNEDVLIKNGDIYVDGVNVGKLDIYYSYFSNCYCDDPYGESCYESDYERLHSASIYIQEEYTDDDGAISYIDICHDEFKINFSNDSDYNESDKQYVNDFVKKLTLAKPQYYEMDYEEYTNELFNGNDIFNYIDKCASKYYNSLIDDPTIKVTVGSGAGGIEGGINPGYGEGGANLAVFKNNVFYGEYYLKNEYDENGCKIWSEGFIPVLIIPDSIADDEIESYILQKVKKDYEGRQNFKFNAISKGAVENGLPVEDGYTLKTNYADVDSIIIARRTNTQKPSTPAENPTAPTTPTQPIQPSQPSTTPNTPTPTQPTAPVQPTPAPTQPTAPAQAVKKPKSTSIKKAKGSKKAVALEWKKVSGVKGYQVQVATDKKFKKNKKTVTIKKQKTTKTTVKKLKAKKKYYVRVRTYKIVNGKKVYSSWSKVKSVKTK